MTAQLVCLALFALRPPVASHEMALQTCIAVYQAAEAAGEDPVEVAAQAGRESGWDPDAVSASGCVGPLQVLPGYFCPGGAVAGCDTIRAGIEARRRFRRSLRRVGRPATAAELLCVYQRGFVHPRGKGCAYARTILEWTRRARLELAEDERP